MKRTLVILLAVSLLANGAFAVRAVLQRRPVPLSPVPAPTAPRPVAEPEQPACAAPKVWVRQPGEDARAFAKRLRESGMDDAPARLLVRDALRQEYLERQRELIGTADPADFWKSASAAADRDHQAELRRLARAHQDLLTELYGADESVLAERERERRLYGPLPDEKLARIDRLHADYGEMAEDVRTRSGGVLLSADRETLELLDQERRKDVAALLTPAELEVYDLQTSATARTLRARLAAFAPSEAEFRALFALQRKHEAQAAGGADGAAAELEAGIRSALGDARYVEYRRTQDSQYRLAARIAERFGLPSRRAGEVFALADAAQARLRQLRDDRTLAAGAAHEALAKLARESAERLGVLLGDDGADLYRQTSAGAWLRALERAVVETAAAVPAGKPDSAEPAPAAPEPSPATVGAAVPLAVQPKG